MENGKSNYNISQNPGAFATHLPIAYVRPYTALYTASICNTDTVRTAPTDLQKLTINGSIN